MAARTPRVWDLERAGDLDLFAAPRGSSRGRDPLPLPSRAIRFPRPVAAPDLKPALPPGVALVTGEDELVLLGPAHRLREAAHRWGCREGSDLVEALDRYESPVRRLVFADGSAWDLASRTHVMGVLNVTPDSFSDGGRFAHVTSAVHRGIELAQEGADVIDVGGESTRPGATPISPDDEKARVVPVIEALRRALPASRLSIDTRRASVARAALEAGADLVNDVSALGDPEMAPLVATWPCPVILMHMRGTPATMQADTHYDDLLGEIIDFLFERAQQARSAGIHDARILVDPGLGFGKSARGNERLLRQTRAIGSLGLPVVVGASRKSFLGVRGGVEDASSRLAESLAAAVIAANAGADFVRVHDVDATRRALAVADAIARAGESGGAGSA